MKLTNTSTKDKRQIGIINDWRIKFNHIGGVVASTGFGKTTGIALRAIQLIKLKSIIFVVPTLKLQEDTKELFKKFNIQGEVLVINTASKNTNKYKCDLLVIDEADRAVAETFINIFNTITYKKLLWLTATIERTDGRHELLLNKAPIVDTVSLKECVKNKWTESIDSFKVPVQLTSEERSIYNKLNEKIEDLKTELGGKNPMNEATDAIMYLDRKKWVVSKNKGIPTFRSEIKKWFNLDPKYNINKEKSKFRKDEILKIRRALTRKGFKSTIKSYNIFIELLYIVPEKDHTIFVRAITAKKYLTQIRKRKDLLYNAENKFNKTLELVEENKDKYKFVIGQKISFLEDLRDALPEKDTGIYHSKLKKKEKDFFFRKFNDGRTRMKTLISAKSLVAGVDIPRLEVVIVSSYTSSKRDATQLMGRISRLYPNKKPKLYYLYCENTIEETSWLQNILKNEKVTKL